MNMKKNLTCAMLIFVSGLTGAAEATNGVDPARTTVVRFADLNLKSPEGVAILYGRIRHAARRVCGYPETTRQVSLGLIAKECLRTATDHAVAQVALPALTSLHQERTGRVSKPDRLAEN